MTTGTEAALVVEPDQEPTPDPESTPDPTDPLVDPEPTDEPTDPVDPDPVIDINPEPTDPDIGDTGSDDEVVVVNPDEDGVDAGAVIVTDEETAEELKLVPADDTKRGAETGEGVGSTNPLLVAGGVTALLASLDAAILLMVRRGREALSVKE